MQHVNGALETDRIDGSIRGPVAVLNNLKHARPLALPRFRRRVRAAKLGDAERGADTILDRFGELDQVPFRAPTQYSGSSPATGLRAMYLNS